QNPSRDLPRLPSKFQQVTAEGGTSLSAPLRQRTSSYVPHLNSFIVVKYSSSDCKLSCCRWNRPW
ncbi:hypothetical protein C9890_0316, partial [Perkinsus sp. BL_2016]